MRDVRWKKTLRTIAVISIAAVMGFGGVQADVSCAAAKPIVFKNLNNCTVISAGTVVPIRYQLKGKYRKKRVGFISSNKAVAIVTRTGVLKAKKNGKVTITIFVKGKKSVRRSVKIRVGQKVEAVRITGIPYLLPGKSTDLDAVVTPSNAALKSVTWKTSNKKVVTVTKTGKIKAEKPGTATIVARAKDGSGKRASIHVVVFQFKKNQQKWIAHRGLRSPAKENSAGAFREAGENGFWGCECDVWETKHTRETQTEEPFDLVINHDPTFQRVHGVNRKIKDMTAREIRNNAKLKDVCFIDTYLSICRQYDMVPIVELKDPDMSDDAIKKVADDLIRVHGFRHASDFYLISFHAKVLAQAKTYIEEHYRFTPLTQYLVGGVKAPNDLTAFELAKDAGFSGITIHRSLMTDVYDQYCRKNGMLLGTWGYSSAVGTSAILYQHLMEHHYRFDTVTIDSRLYK